MTEEDNRSDVLILLGAIFGAIAAMLGALVIFSKYKRDARQDYQPDKESHGRQRYRQRDPSDDMRAIVGDWQRVGNDLRAAEKRFVTKRDGGDDAAEWASPAAQRSIAVRAD